MAPAARCPPPTPPPKGGTGGNPTVSGASPRRRGPHTRLAVGFSFLASNQGITDNPGATRACTAWHFHDLATHIAHAKEKGRTRAPASGLSQPGQEGPGGRRAVPPQLSTLILGQNPPSPPGRPGHSNVSHADQPGTLQKPGEPTQHLWGGRGCREPVGPSRTESRIRWPPGIHGHCPTGDPERQLDVASQVQALGPGSLCLSFLIYGTQGKGVASATPQPQAARP